LPTRRDGATTKDNRRIFGFGGQAILILVAPPALNEEGIDQHYPANDYAFGLKKPRRKQIRQRPYSSSARGMVPACPARCLRWSPNVQMPAPSGTRIGAVSSAARGVATLVAVTRATVGAERWCGRRRRGTGTLRFTTAAIDTCMGGLKNDLLWRFVFPESLE